MSKAGSPEKSEAGVQLDVAALFREHAAFLLRSVQRMTGPGPHVEDIVQETFLVAHRRREEIAEHPEVRGWLFRVAQNLVQHHRRTYARKARLAEAVGSEPEEQRSEVSGPVRRQQARDQIRDVVAELPEHEQAIFILYELEEMTGAQIAKVLDLPEGTVWTRLNAAREHFKALWMDKTREEGS